MIRAYESTNNGESGTVYINDDSIAMILDDGSGKRTVCFIRGREPMVGDGLHVESINVDSGPDIEFRVV